MSSSSSSPLDMRLRSPFGTSPRSKTSPRSLPRRRTLFGSHASSSTGSSIGPPWLVRWLIPCTLPLLLLSQWMIQRQSQASVANGRLWIFYSNHSDADAVDTTSSNDDEADASQINSNDWNSNNLRVASSQIDRSPSQEQQEALLLRNQAQQQLAKQILAASSSAAASESSPGSSSFPSSTTPTVPFITPSWPPLFIKNSSQPIPVAWLAAHQVNDSSVTYLGDDLERSKYMNLVQTFDYQVETRQWNRFAITDEDSDDEVEPVVLIVDWASLERDCHVLERLLLVSNDDAHSPSYQYLVYHDTTPSSRVVHCRNLEEANNDKKVVYVKQSIVQDRYWNHTLQWIEPGQAIPEVLLTDSLSDGLQAAQQPSSSLAVQFAPRSLPQDFVTRLNQRLESRNRISVFNFTRTVDIAVLARNGSHASYTFLRDHVSQNLMQHARKKKYSIQFLGDPMDLKTDDKLLDVLLKAKLVVVVQPDEWQETTGMLEAMASGAMVLSDSILQPGVVDDNGTITTPLVDKTHLVFFDSVPSLLDSVDYYIKHKGSRMAIAKKGWEYSMGLQRSWQSLETVLFGSAWTHAGQPYHPAPPRRHE